MVMRVSATLIAGLIALPVASSAEIPVSEQGNAAPVRLVACVSSKDHAGILSARFGEHPVFTGQLDTGMVLRIFANGKSGSWTMLVVRTDGTSCVQSAGESGPRDMGY